MQYEPLVDDGCPELHGTGFAGPEERQPVVMVGLYHGVGLPREDVGQVLYLEMLRKGLHQREDQRHLPAAVKAGTRMQAVVATAAVVLRVILAEVIEQQLPAALVGLGVSHGLTQQLTADLLLGNRFALHELLQFLDILVAVIGYALAFLAVSSGPSRLLVITLDALGNVIMDHKTHVGLVYSHSEGDGGHNHVYILHQEGILVLRPGPGIQPSMVRQGLYSVDREEGGEFLDLLPAEAVDNAALPLVLADELDNVLFRIDLVPDFIIEVGAVERRLENRGVLDAEILEDVALNLGRGGGGKGDYGRRGYLVYDGTDAAVFRTEVVPPFRDAVSLVHCVERYVDLLEKGYVLFLGKRLRGYVEQFCGP